MEPEGLQRRASAPEEPEGLQTDSPLQRGASAAPKKILRSGRSRNSSKKGSRFSSKRSQISSMHGSRLAPKGASAPKGARGAPKRSLCSRRSRNGSRKEPFQLQREPDQLYAWEQEGLLREPLLQSQRGSKRSLRSRGAIGAPRRSLRSIGS